ncbi:hypothetical protein K493DRAFT_345933 [Basidiobolus meristosporus CBS 931.73]|uniref:Uncharacterized protein n=1 Tax=Basidiobolus meristosporus CBS 931.73 TaxID=1314790 RepID=A0A1Y1Z126_9FUNG|nr:hypothetical protein K493DRAFT_345933 [Basidiobolus meristosporus CBS 931.73]|eukprot:ORY03896.1 hypothetical protein K493DRAFT_345933 [Basidiobolus meristosporus CBS 931.73]
MRELNERAIIIKYRRRERERVYKNLEDDQPSRRARRQRERGTRTVVDLHKNVDDSSDLLEQVAAVAPAPVLSSNIFSQTSKPSVVERRKVSPESTKVEEHEIFQTPRVFEMKTTSSKYHSFKGALSPTETVSKFLHAKGNAHMEAEELEGCVALLKNELQEEQNVLETIRSAVKRPFLPSTQKITTTVPRTALFSSRKKKAPLYFGPGFGRHSAPYRKLIKPPVYNSPSSTKRARVDLYGSQKEVGNLQTSIREKTSASSSRNSTLIRSSIQAQTPGKHVDFEDAKTQKGSATARRIMDIIGEMDPQPVAPVAQDILNPYELASPISHRRVDPKPKPEIVAKAITTSDATVHKKLTPMELLEKSMPKELRDEAPPVASISSFVAPPLTKEAPSAIETIPSPSANGTQSEPEVAVKNLEDAFRGKNSILIIVIRIQKIINPLEIEPGSSNLALAFDQSNRDMQVVAKLSESELPTYQFGTESDKVNTRLDLSNATDLTQEPPEMKFEFTLEPAYDQQDVTLREAKIISTLCLVSYLTLVFGRPIPTEGTGSALKQHSNNWKKQLDTAVDYKPGDEYAENEFEDYVDDYMFLLPDGSQPSHPDEQ